MKKRPAPAAPPPLSPAQFKALAKFKGWRYTELAARWGLQPETVSAIARNPERQVRYDDMLRGLPNLNHFGRDQRRWNDQLAAAELLIRKADQGKEGESRAPSGPGFRYHSYIVLGSIVTASTQVGEMAEEGERGIVFHVQRETEREVYGIIFESGAYDWFTPEYIDIYVAGSGLIAPGIDGFVFDGSEGLQDYYNDNHFNFWPVVPEV